VEQRGKYGNAGSLASQATDNCRPDDNHRSEGSQGGNSGESGQTHINSPSVEASGAVERLRGKNIQAPAYTTCHAEAERRRMITFTRIPYDAASRPRAMPGSYRLHRLNRLGDVDIGVVGLSASTLRLIAR
jgi:hypothetical protein